MPTQFEIRTLRGISEIAEQYEGFILDLWGVLHNGVKLFDGVVECLEKLKERTKTVVLFSNAPRSFGAVIEKLNELGLPRHLYDDVITSGDITLDYLRRHPSKTYYHIGVPEKDSSLLVGIGKNPVEDITDAEIIVVSNLQEDRPKLTDYHDQFRRAILKRIPMVCANPDIVVHKDGVSQLCAGALAAEYEKLGGQVHYFGKPHPNIYKSLQKLYPKGRFLAVGDSLATDIKGAQQAEVDSAFVLSGIHHNEVFIDDASSWSLCEKYKAYPKYILQNFCW